MENALSIFEYKFVLPISRYTTKIITRIVFHKTKDCYRATVYFQDKTFYLSYYIKNFEHFYPKELKGITDIYYERAFEMFRSKDASTRVWKAKLERGLLST